MNAAVIIDCVQGGQDWHDNRAGKITASCFKHVMGSPAAQRSYLRLLRGERNGPPDDLPALEWGRKNEAAARADFEFETGLEVRQVGLIIHPELDYVAASPDGLIDPDEGAEIKCPLNPEIHAATVLSRRMPDEHYAQVQGGLWVTGRRRWHFVSFDPRAPMHLRRFHQIIPRDEQYIARLDTRVREFYQHLINGTDPQDIDYFGAAIPFLNSHSFT